MPQVPQGGRAGTIVRCCRCKASPFPEAITEEVGFTQELDETWGIISSTLVVFIGIPRPMITNDTKHLITSKTQICNAVEKRVQVSDSQSGAILFLYVRVNKMKKKINQKM